MAVLILVALAVGLVLVDPLDVRSDETAVGWRNDASPEDLAPSDDGPELPELPGGLPEDPTAPTTTAPQTPTTAPPERLAPAPQLPAEQGAYAFIGTEADGDPITWDPCETIQYVVNVHRAPPGAAEILAEALAQVSQATGLVFEDRGLTDEPPSFERELEDPARYGDGWSPVNIAWTDPHELPLLTEEDAAGLAGPSWVPTGGGEMEHVSGTVALDGVLSAELIEEGRRSDILHLVMHELGHLVGLDHVGEQAEVMYDGYDSLWRPEWGPGDRTGLAMVGSGECDPDV